MARRRVTSADVARRAGVSRTTVSFVLNDVPGVRISEETRRRVLEAARELGYTPDAAARALAGRRTYTLGFVLCQSPDQVFHDAFLPEVLVGVSEVAREAGYRVLVEPVEDVHAPEAYAGLVRERRVDGLLLSGPRADDRQLLELWEEGVPIVLLGQLPGTEIPFVDVDNVRGARRAVEHLLDLGHRRIGIVTNAPPAYTASQQRLQGYREALRARGIPEDPSLIRHGAFDEESGYRAMEALLELPDPPTAVFVASDLVAVGALAALRARGIPVPEQVAVVGFDDVRLARYVSPPLTTVHLPARDLGATAARLLLDWLEDGRPPQGGTLLATELVVRESCGARRVGKPGKGGESPKGRRPRRSVRNRKIPKEGG